MAAIDSLSTYEQVLLLGLHDEKGSDTTGTGVLDHGVAGAALIDLLRAGALAEDGKEVVTTGPPPGDPFLAAVHAEIAADERPRRPKHWVDKLPGRLKPFLPQAAARLVDAGVLGEEHRKVLGLFAQTRLPERDGAPERELRAALHDVLVVGRQPTPAEAELVAVVQALELVPKVVAKEDRGAAKRRAKEVAEAGPASDAVHRAVQDVHAALATSVAVSAATITTTS